MENSRKYGKQFFEQLTFLATVEREARGANEASDVEHNVNKLSRLLRLNHNIMGERAVANITVALTWWKRKQKSETTQEQSTDGDEPQHVMLGDTFARKMEDLGFIIIPKKSRNFCSV